VLTLIVNPSSGGGRAGRALPAVQAALSAHGLEHRIEPTRSLEHAGELARHAQARGEPAVALGGDGLIGAVAGALRDTGGVLGVLPGGRGNDFARALGIPLDPVAACAVLATGVVRELDLGEAGGRSFIGIASCGLDSDANRIANEARAIRGSLVYAYGALRALAAWEPARFELTLDGVTHTLVGMTVAVANGAGYGGGMLMAPGASLQDGELDVVTVAASSKLVFLRNLPRVFKGTHVDLPVVEVRRAREVALAADRPFTMYADGDPIAELPVSIRCLPAAVRALVPSP